MRNARILSLLLAISVGAAAAASAGVVEARIDSEGKVLRLSSGVHSELFAGSEDPSTVLVLDVVGPEGATERHLVPGTESLSPESSPRLVYESANGAAYLLWEGFVAGVHPVLFLTSFDGTGFSDLIEITSGLFSHKGAPDLVVTRDSDVDDEGAAHVRTVMHLTWWHETPTISRKLYAAVVLEDGDYLGWTPIFDLSSLVGQSEVGGWVPAPQQNLLRVRSGADHRGVVIGFVDPDSGALVALRAELQPRALSDLAEKARGHIIGIGLRAKTRLELAEDVSAAVLDSGGAFHPAAIEYLATSVREHILASSLPLDEEGLPLLADSARGHIIGIGARIRSAGLASDAGSRFLTIGAEVDDPTVRHLIEVSRVAAWEVPDGVGAAPRLFLSPSGADALVAWDRGGRVHYRETTGQEWSPMSTIESRDGLEVEAIYEMLAERIADR